MTRERMMSIRRDAVLLFSVVLGAAVVCSCGGAKTGDIASTNATPQTSQAAPEAAPPAQAANDPAKAPPPAAADDSRDDHRYDPATAAGAIRGVPAPTNTASIEAVANFYTEIPGVDLTALDTHGREKFLHRVNSELCTCGCKNDTIAKCAVNDPKCKVVKGLVQKVYDEVKAGR